MSEAVFKFPLIEGRQTYARTVSLFYSGVLTCGFLWEMAERDEVFQAYLKREGVPKP